MAVEYSNTSPRCSKEVLMSTEARAEIRKDGSLEHMLIAVSAMAAALQADSD